MITTTPLILLVLMILSSLSLCNQVLHESQVTSTAPLHTRTEPAHYQYHSKGARFVRVVPSPPPKPVLFIVNITCVNITWTYPPTQPPTQFIVQSYSSSSPYHNISQMLNSTYYLYNGMAMGSFYMFRVIAYQNGVPSTPSENTDVFINGANAPTGPPSNFQAHIMSSTSVELTWNSPKPDIDRVYTYHIFKGDGPTNLVQVDSISNENSYSFTKLLPEHTYYFAVQADVSAIKSIMTPVVNVTTPSSRLDPLNIVNITVNVTMATVTWTPPSKHITLLQHYTVYYAVDALVDHASINNISFYYAKIFDVNSHMGVIQNLEEGVVYVFRVQYTANWQTSELSDPVTAQTLSSINCFVCESISSNQIWLKWLINNPNGKLYHYVLHSPSCINATISSANSIVSYNSTELSPWTLCQYSIAIDTMYGYLSQPSLCPSCRTLEARPNGSPRNFTVNVLSSSSIILTWEPLPIEEQNGPITSYIVICRGCPRGISTYTNSPATVKGLTPYSTYQFTVAAQNKADVGPETPPISIRTLEDKPAGPPLDISLINATMTSFTIRWSPPQQSNGIILFYTVTYCCKENRTVSLNTTNTIITLSNLQQSTQYTVQIMAWTSIGSGPLSESQSFKTVHSTGIDTITTPPNISLTTKVIDKSLLHCFKVLISWNLTAQNAYSANYTLTYSTSTINVTKITLNKLNYVILSFGQLKSDTNYSFQLDIDLPFYNDSLTQVKSLNTPRCTGVITLVVVVSMLVGAFLLVLCVLCVSCLFLCYYHRYKRHHRQTTSYAMDIMHQPLSIPNEYVTVMRENRGDGQSSVSDNSYDSAHHSDSVFNRIVGESDSTDSDFDNDERRPLMEATPPIIRPTPVSLPPPYNFNSFVISSEGYIINEPVDREDEECHEDIMSDYSGRLIPIGSSIESSPSSTSNELYFN